MGTFELLWFMDDEPTPEVGAPGGGELDLGPFEGKPKGGWVQQGGV